MTHVQPQDMNLRPKDVGHHRMAPARASVKFTRIKRLEVSGGGVSAIGRQPLWATQTSLYYRPKSSIWVNASGYAVGTGSNGNQRLLIVVQFHTRDSHFAAGP